MMCAEAREGVPLSSLLRGIVDVSPGPDTTVLGICADSRKVYSGDLFLALAGRSHHGLQFLPRVVAAGARAVLWEPPAGVQAECDVPCFPIPELSLHAGEIADRFYGQPSAAQRVIGVTGTDGKTSCTHFIAEALSKSGLSCGLIGTLGYGVFGALETSTHTTPDAVSVQRILAEIHALGGTHVAMEVSSHGLDQGRVRGVRFDTAVLTNLTRDHLDYHGTAEAYADAKARLFRDASPRTVILNLDDPFGRHLAASLPGAQRVGYTLGSVLIPGVRTLRAEKVELRPDGMRFLLSGDWGVGRVETGLFGRFNLANLLVAIAVLLTEAIPFDKALECVSQLRTVPGRMQRFGGGGKPLIVVDYAHTPNALRQVLTALREHGRGALLCVFGCGGDRDRGKRSAMADAAESLADLAIVTDDNPRGEDPDRIVADIVSGFTSAARHEVVRNRRSAIARAVTLAGPSDTVLIAGKGHEDYQLVGDRRLRFSDAETVAEMVGRQP